MSLQHRRLGQAVQLTQGEEREILRRLWGSRLNPFQPRRPYRRADYRPFFQYLTEECTYVQVERHLVQNYKQLIAVIGKLKSLRALNRAVIVFQIRQLDINWWTHEVGGTVPQWYDWQQACGDEECVSNSLMLAMKIWLMVTLGPTGNQVAGQAHPVLWEYQSRIDDVLKSRFDPPDPPEPEKEDRSRDFPLMFTLRYMEMLAGFSIKPTNDILSHLLIEQYPDSGWQIQVKVFHQATILEELWKGDADSQLGPDGAFAKETLETLGLLLPGTDEQWFYDKCIRGRLDPSHEIDVLAAQQHTVTREVAHYKFWRARLLRLEEEFVKSKRASLFTYVKDGRRPRERANFCVAALAVTLALLGLAITLAALLLAGFTWYETRKANSIASGASKAADSAATTLVAAFNSSKSSPLPIIVCCSASTTGNNSIVAMSSSTYQSASTIKSASLVIVTSTVLVITTATAHVTDFLTSTILTTV